MLRFREKSLVPAIYIVDNLVEKYIVDNLDCVALLTAPLHSLHSGGCRVSGGGRKLKLMSEAPFKRKLMKAVCNPPFGVTNSLRDVTYFIQHVPGDVH